MITMTTMVVVVMMVVMMVMMMMVDGWTYQGRFPHEEHNY